MVKWNKSEGICSVLNKVSGISEGIPYLELDINKLYVEYYNK